MPAGRLAAPALDVIHPSGERTRIPIEPLPFRIGRGAENDLILRDNRASRAHASISGDDGTLVIEDLDSLHGTWVNGKRIESPTVLKTGDTVHFGFEDSYRLVFTDSHRRIGRIVDEISASSKVAGPVGTLGRLRSLVEIARTLQTSLAADEVLSAVVDAALALTGAERGFLLLRSAGELQIKVGRDRLGSNLSESDLNVSTSLIDRALHERRELLSMTLPPDHFEAHGLPEDQMEFRNVICVPLVHLRGVNTEETLSLSSERDTVGVLYLDSRQKQAALSELNRELLHTLALEASTVLEDANLLEEERQRRALEQELGFARKIQQSLLPQEFPTSGWLLAAGSSLPSAEVAGDYFDVRPIGSEAWAATIADVSGKGVSSALLASLLQGAFLLGSELGVELDALMAKINGFLIDRAQREKYATVFYGRIHRSGDLSWANAGHCAPFLVASSGEIRTLETTGMPLGLVPNAEFAVERVKLFPGDKIIAYSDGLTDAENDRGETFEAILRKAVRDLGALSAQEIHDRLMADVLKFRGGDEMRDDVTLLVLEYRGGNS
ncbi:MAG: SpoIIE family protein phosphatase [Acidobacteriaceae bacterium]|nr:SpoIIE family protein phosphatase [Acidobacteriaceae bacterium]